ncbi:MAG TPA: alpha/beta fold hydrolase, partial [Paracoccaceae bacterium]|nr:alpha/beta fold hydrolase [Paracoccaceae bacterium]
EPAAFDGFWTALAGETAPPGRGESWRALAGAGARYRGVVLAAWGRVRAAFEIQRHAMIDPSLPPPDWRALRERWFAIAEAEFIRTQRSDEFLAAQRDVLRAVLRWRDEISEPERANLATLRTGTRLAAQLGLDAIRIATTPKDEVWRDGKAVLSRYRPLGAPPTLGPLVICYGLIGRQTMTDLTPDRSLVRNLLAAGVDVFALDWGHAGPEDAGHGFDHYADAQLGRALAAVREASGAARPVLFGICQGGVFAACHAARHRASIAGLILAVTPIDFHADRQDADPAHGLLNLWVRSLDEADLGGMADAGGNLPGELMSLVFNQLNPVRTIAKYVVELPEAARDPRALATFLAMEKWLADRPDLPGALAHDWLIGLYLRNELTAGRFRMGGVAVELGRIGVPVLNIHAAADHIIPASCAQALARHVAPRLYRELSLPTGHVGVFVSARSQALLAPAITGWMRDLAG